MEPTALAVIRQRVSINLYQPDSTLSDAEISALVEYASQAPSSFNFQNWRFIAVRDSDAKRKLEASAYGQVKVSHASVTFIVLGLLNPQLKLSEALAPSLEAGILDQTTVDTWVAMANGMYGSNPQLQRDEAVRSASLAAMTLMLAAEAMGLASGPMIGFDPAAVRADFALSEDEIPAMLVTVGRRAPGNWPRKPRFAVSSILKII